MNKTILKTFLISSVFAFSIGCGFDNADSIPRLKVRLDAGFVLLEDSIKLDAGYDDVGLFVDAETFDKDSGVVCKIKKPKKEKKCDCDK